jgi:hypothetical protein
LPGGLFRFYGEILGLFQAFVADSSTEGGANGNFMEQE